MAFENCRLDDDEKRTYHPGYPWQEWLHGEFMPGAGTIDRENDIRLFNYGNGPVDEPSDLFQFIFDYKGIPLKVEFRQALKDWDVYWYGGYIEPDKVFPYDIKDIMQALHDAMKVYAYRGYDFMEMNRKVTVHIEF